MKTYEFTIKLRGSGESIDEAYHNACEAFELDWGETPEDYKIEDDEQPVNVFKI